MLTCHEKIRIEKRKRLIPATSMKLSELSGAPMVEFRYWGADWGLLLNGQLIMILINHIFLVRTFSR